MNHSLQFPVVHRRFALFAFSLIISLLLGITAGQRSAAAADDWQFADRQLRLPISIDANGFSRDDKLADVSLNFTSLLSEGGVNGAFDPDSIRVVEVEANGTALNPDVEFQFDPAVSYNGNNNALGTLVILLDGITGAAATRHFHVYFDAVGTSYSPPAIAPRITFTDAFMSQGFSSFKFETDTATYVYHKQGGGFSKLLDANGDDWINWSTDSGAAGDYRGIPNLVNPNDGGYFHPGRTTSSSTVLNEGPLKVTIKSTSNNNAWSTIWEIYPEYARLTVTKAATKYWFLYEGTPGGELTNSDRIFRPNESQTPGFGSWTGDIGGDEWVYFQDPNETQSLFMAHEQLDTIVDSYRALGNEMTVFGFGRNGGSGRYLVNVPQSFVFGFGEGANHAALTTIIEGAYKPLSINLGDVETTGSGPVCNEPSERKYFSSKALGTIDGINFGDEDVLMYDGQTCEWSLVFDGSAAGLVGKADIDALEVGEDGDFYLSFDQALNIPITGNVDDSDIVHYQGGVFTLWFDGSLFGLTTDAEDIDAITFDTDGNLIVSTFGSYVVSGLVKGTDDDLLRLTGGVWSLAFDGSHNAGLVNEDVTGVAWRENGDIALNLLDAFVLGPVSGNGDDILNCVPSSLGPLTTECDYTLVWDGSARGFSGVDAIAIEPVAAP